MSVRKFDMQIGKRKLQLLFDLEEEFYSDQALFYMLSRGIVPEPEVVNALPHILEPGDCCVDAGANIGFFTVIMSKLVGKQDGLVIAIEPDLRNAKKLRKNLDINDCRNVSVVEAPLSDRKDQHVFFRLRAENGTSSMFGDHDADDLLSPMHTRILSDLIDGQEPKLMKMDIEGAELAAIKGCNSSIPFVISEVNDAALKLAGASVLELRAYMEAVWGHRTHILSETGGMPAILSPKQNLVATRQNANVLFAREWNVIRAWPDVTI